MEISTSHGLIAVLANGFWCINATKMMTEDVMWPRIADVPPLREISLDFRSTLTEHHGLKHEMLMVPIPSQLLPMDTKSKHWVILCG